MKTLQPRKYQSLLWAMIFILGIMDGFSQTLQKPVPDFTNACATASFNNFKVAFKWTVPLVDSSNEFILEISDPDGSFDQPDTLAVVSDKNTTFEFNINFAFPEDTKGDNYRVRVKSTNPARVSPESDAFSAYFNNVTEALVINNFQEASICDGNSYVLSVDNFPDEPSYNWYKDMTLIPGAKEAFLEVSEPGIYFAEVDYGDYCSVNTASNLVEVYTESALGITLEGVSNITLCEGDTYTLTANIDDNTLLYNWYKDGELLAQNNEYTFAVDTATPGFEGEYYLVVESTLSTCQETSNTITVSSDAFDTAIETPDGNVLLPGTVLQLEATTSGNNPGFEWYKNDVLIAGENTASLSVSTPGNYKAKIIVSGSCVSEKFTPEVEVVSPDSFTVTLDTSGYSECMTGSLSLLLDGVSAVAGASTYDLPGSALDGLSYQWTLNGATLSGETGRNISVSGTNASGTYNLEVNIDGVTYTATPVEIKMGLTETPAINAPVTVTCNDGTLLDVTSNITSPDYTYTWYRNGVAMGEVTPELQTTLPGTYYLEIAANGCTAASNEVTIDEISQDLVQLDVPSKFTVPEGETRVVTATGGDSYIWYDTELRELSTANTVTLSEEGQYMVKAMVGNCEVAKTIELTYQLSYSVPNAVTPNGDGFNDLWVLPSAYAYQPDIQVTIYDESGIQVFTASEYQNNWPQSNDNLNYKGGRPPIYYYTISKGKDIVKRGTITVIR